jgi:hypothetical protein
MPQKVLKFTGINRKVNEYQNSGACEELINLRPEVGGGYRVIREKDIYKTGVSYDMIYEHSFGNTTNLVVSTNGVVWWLKDKNNLGEITSDFAQKGGVSISSAGNVLVVYCKEEDRQLAFKFENEEYVSYDFAPKQITNVEIAYAAGTTYYTAVADDSSAGALNAALQKAASGFNQTYPNGLCGYSIVGCSYELEDGQELWSTAFVVANGEITSGYQQPSINAEAKTAQVSGARKIYLCLSFADMPYSGIRKINVYATRPVFPYFVENTMSTSFKISKQSLEEMDLGGQIMYYQGSIDPRETSARLLLKFNSEQAGEDIMKVMSGCIYRTGQMVSYNNRFHFYDSTAKHTLQLPSVSRDSQLFTIMGSNSPEVFKDAVENDNGDIAPYWIAYVKINNEWKLIDKVYRFFETDINDFIYPMAGVKQLVFVKAAMTGSTLSVPYEEMFYVDLKDSAAYNYSHAFNVTPSIVSATDFHSDMQAAGQIWGNGFDTSVTWKKEENAVNVSSPFNPFVFPVEYSYSFGGEIRDITTAYLPISSTQAGQYPLIVFTSNGIYALEQGNGAVLYGNVVPLQPQVINGRAKATPYGTFFVSSNNLYVLSGREAGEISSTLNGERELNLRESRSYEALCLTDGVLHNFSDILSGEDFEDFITNTILNYDQHRNELIISSSKKGVNYSYVFNIDTKLYHKISNKYLSSQNGARYLLDDLGEVRNIVDMYTEVKSNERHILLQSRPFSLEMLYSHIHRLQMFVDAKLEEGQNLCLSVFGSDNLYDWKCIISSQKQNTVLRQITTNRAAKSYKDYVILINGTVSTDTDLSEIIADYTVVSRRLG